MTLKDGKFKHARNLLKADEGLSDPQIMTALNVSHPLLNGVANALLSMVWSEL
jgi:hypothetical protein